MLLLNTISLFIFFIIFIVPIDCFANTSPQISTYLPIKDLFSNRAINFLLLHHLALTHCIEKFSSQPASSLIISAKSFIDIPFSIPTLNKWCPSGRVLLILISAVAPSSTYNHS